MKLAQKVKMDPSITPEHFYSQLSLSVIERGLQEKV